MSKRVLGIIIGVIVLAGAIGVYFFYIKGGAETDAVKFSKEYSSISENNPFVYRSEDEIIKILENGTGVVYLGFPECPWCQKYVTYLYEVAKEQSIEKIYYLNVREIRKNNTKEYQKIVSLLNENLLSDDEGNKRVFVPDVTIVKNGVILGHDNETSVVTESDGTPEEYWTIERENSLKTKLSQLIKQIKETSCNTCQ